MRKGQAATPSITAEAVHTFGDEMKEQAATVSAITAIGSDARRVVTEVDVIEEEVGAAKKLLEKTKRRVEKVVDAIQERAKKIQQMEEGLVKMNAGGPAERITRRKKTVGNDVGESERGQRNTLNGWVDWDRKMETVMETADARRLLDNVISSLPAHRRAFIDEEVTYSDLSGKGASIEVYDQDQGRE